MIPKILIVDDHEEQRVATKTAVFIAAKKIGVSCETVQAENLEDAFSYFVVPENLPCLVIIDMHLPKKRKGPDREYSEYAGYLLLKAISEKYPDVWWLVVSGQPHLNQIVIEEEGRSLLSAINSHSNVIGVWFKTREADLLRILEQFLLFQNQMEEYPNGLLNKGGSIREQVNNLEFYIATSANSLSIYNKIRMLAKGSRSILIIGEKGSGKELVSKLIHSFANEDIQEKKRYKKINGEFINYDTLFMELAKIEDGTLYIENIDKMPKSLQDDITRNLVTIEKYPARIIFGISRHHLSFTPSLVSTDIYLSSFILPLPSLRERLDEILDLSVEVLDRFSREFSINKKIVQLMETYQVLSNCTWENNLDDLRLVIYQAATTTANPAIGCDDIMDVVKQRKVYKE